LTRKLIALDVALVVLLALLVAQVRREWLSAKSREQAFLSKVVKPTVAQPLVPYPKPAPLMASGYASVAQMNLFAQDRNSNVILDPPAPVVVKPVPPFPPARGVMLWEGMPPTVVLTDKGVQKGYHPGDTIGEWKIVSIDNQFVVFEWEGKQFQKRLDELLDKTALLASEGPAPAGGAPNAAATNLTPPAPTVQTLSQGKAEGPGPNLGGGVNGCVAGDTSPAGTVSGGMRKVVTSTPFGSSCHWESAR
jgi:type II secretory pathway component PulC